jgi:hypothetical protein
MGMFVVMAVAFMVMMAVTVFVRVTADFHIIAAVSASAFFAHKINSGLTTKYTKHTKHHKRGFSSFRVIRVFRGC